MALLREDFIINGRYRPHALGDLVSHLMDARVRPRKQTDDPVRNAWEQVVPPGLAEHCRIKTFVCGRLSITVDNPAYLYELQLCRAELQQAIQALLPQTRINNIKLTLE
ncbi:DUF721 domain-containing protein [Planctomycetota bacterium]